MRENPSMVKLDRVMLSDEWEDRFSLGWANTRTDIGSYSNMSKNGKGED